MGSNRTILWFAVVAIAVFLFSPELVSARDLSSAATSAVSSAKTIARTLSVLGLLVGGILMQLPGCSQIGKNTLGAGIVGCLCSFGGPAFISLLEGIFGST